MDRPVADTDPRPLLDDDEPAPYEIVNPDGRSRVILTCDHASRRIPRRLGTLGVAPADLKRHIAWDFGVLHRWDRRLADLMLMALRGGELAVGDNQPYRVALDEDYTIPIHAESRGMPYALLEIRQDLVAADAGAEDWAGRLAGILDGVLDDPGVGHYTTPAPEVSEPRFN